MRCKAPNGQQPEGAVNARFALHRGVAADEALFGIVLTAEYHDPIFPAI
jgi:hypothetical protein